MDILKVVLGIKTDKCMQLMNMHLTQFKWAVTQKM